MSISLSVQDRPSRSRVGTATVINDELLSDLAEALKKVPAGKVVVIELVRPTRGSAASFGHQVRKSLANRGIAVSASSIPVDEKKTAKTDPHYAGLSPVGDVVAASVKPKA